MKNLLVLFAVIILALTGCSYYAYFPNPGVEAPTQTNPQDVKIYSGDIDQEYVIIGAIAVDVTGEGEKLDVYLKDKAAELGADAVIKVELTKMSSEYHRTGLSGVAVKLR